MLFYLRVHQKKRQSRELAESIEDARSVKLSTMLPVSKLETIFFKDSVSQNLRCTCIQFARIYASSRDQLEMSHQQKLPADQCSVTSQQSSSILSQKPGREKD